MYCHDKAYLSKREHHSKRMREIVKPNEWDKKPHGFYHLCILFK